MSTKRCGIYLVTHTLTGRTYVGQSIDIDRRWREHAKGKTGSGILSNAIAKHGWSAFSARIIELCCHDDLNKAEQSWVAELNSTHPAGFNLTTGGAQFKFTDEARKIISDRTKTFMTPEWIARRSEKQRGIPKSAEWKAKMAIRQAMPDNVARMTELARNQSSETREKIAASKRGLVKSEETKARISASKKGQGLGRRNWQMTDEIRAKMSASAKERCARQKQEREACL